jgi:fatty-acyl-CoA synthase
LRAIEYFDRGAEKYASRCAVIDGATRYSYNELHKQTRSIAQAMLANGLRPGDRVAIYSPNDARVLSCMLGLLRAGGVWVPINFRNAIDANVEYLNYVETSWFFYHSKFRDTVRQIRRRVRSLKNLVCLDAPCDVDVALAAFIESARSSEPPAPSGGNHQQDLMGLVPTGGTTGPAKGVCVTNLAWGTMIEMASQYWRCDGATPVCLSVAPLSHAAGVVAFAMFPLGATNVVMSGFDPGEVLRNIEDFRVTHLFLPPTAFYALLAHPDVAKFDYSSLRVFLLAASPVSPDKLKRGVEIFGPCLCQCYGQTEAPMLLTWLDQQTVAAAVAGERPERLASCGKATSAVRLGIMDESGKLLGPKQTGEIVAQGPLVTPGYYQMPEATAEIRTHGWHHTGDVGYYDEQGYFYIVDRKKDMIISGGFNVFSAEVEAGIMALPEVYECAVIGVPDEKWGEAVKAIISLRDGYKLTEEEVIAHCKTKLGGMKAPKSVDFRPEIAKTAVGKIDRKELRRPYWAGFIRSVH